MFNIVLTNKSTYLDGGKREEYAVIYKGCQIGEIHAMSCDEGWKDNKCIYSKTQMRYVGHLFSPKTDVAKIIFYSDNYSTLIGARIALEKEFNKRGLRVSDYMNKAKKAPVESLTAFAYNSDFYPTPEKLAGMMIAGIDLKNISTVLEPSAGKGDLADCLTRAMKKYYGDRTIDCVEYDPNLRYILEGKKYHVVFDDFIKFHSLKKYDLIIMNPPFSNGCSHLLKAIQLQQDGGQICCLLNAETLRNPYTNERQFLKSLLQKYKASVKFIENAFVSAERKTRVSVAIVWINIPSSKNESKILDGLKKAQTENDQIEDPTDVAPSGSIDRMTASFELECRLCKELIREYKAAEPYIMERFNPQSYTKPIIELSVCGSTGKGINECLKAVRSKYWRELCTNNELTSRFTSTLREKYLSMVKDMSEYDFNKFNVQKVVARMNSEIVGGIEEEIYKIFDKMSETHCWYPECDNNIHYFNGWATNKAHKVGMKVILPIYDVFYTYSWAEDSFSASQAYEALADIEKVFNYLDGDVTAEVNTFNKLKIAAESGVTRNINCKYFSVTFYKKGTMHIKMHPKTERIIDALNIFVCKGKNWLPPHYGKKPYNEMNESEKKVIDAFQGKEAYEKVFNNPQLYLYEPNGSMLKLETQM